LVLYGVNNIQDRASITVFPRLSAGSVFRGRTPDDGRRHDVAVLELSPYRIAGFTVDLPQTHLADETSEYSTRRSNPAIDVEWDEERHVLSVLIEDGAELPSLERPPLIRFEFAIVRPGVRAVLVNEDSYRAALIDLITSGLLEDEWDLVESRSVTRYSRDLATKVRYWDLESSTWLPLDPSLLSAFVRDDTPGRN
jgi:hypothetical protein